MKETNATRICVPVCESRASNLVQSALRAAEAADIIELRLDCLTETELVELEHDLARLSPESKRSIIFTLRPHEQGGRRTLTRDERLLFWTSQGSRLLNSGAHFADIESDLALIMTGAQAHCSLLDWSRVICSYHDFGGVPAGLEQIYAHMAATPAQVLKIAVRANDATDCLTVFQLLAQARAAGREIIALAMGAAGIATRILGPSRGAFLTYGSLDEAHATAPGQLTADELRHLYRVDKLDEQTQVTGLIGLPVMHSVSPHIHNAAFDALGVNAVYIPFEVHDADAFLRRMIHPRTREMSWNMRGLSVTAPYKSAVLNLLDHIEPSAREIGAVNTIVIEEDALCGYNTDAVALVAALEERTGSVPGARVAVIGAGGAARASLWGLQQAGADVTIFARHVESASELVQKFGVRCEPLEGALFSGYDVVINATPLGTRGEHEAETPALAEQLHGARLAYDLVYNPRETRFLGEAQRAGSATLGGLEMLVAQAAQQFKLWTGLHAPIEIMREAAAGVLDRREKLSQG
jgi:3-dehydroquinate dehydratase/shikimate dehydrogenase